MSRNILPIAFAVVLSEPENYEPFHGLVSDTKTNHYGAESLNLYVHSRVYRRKGHFEVGANLCRVEQRMRSGRAFRASAIAPTLLLSQDSDGSQEISNQAV
eukprot:CAMPEP_0171900146 /NCGR_PEP_ID=MMETSP0992-20121227/49625_1 /TAXON_ID=483369 /ORGANISM="non described non described, Strain CCMP2098" /LENGTH=100 /DNA_ID=CAMNT_0012528545 /DNA_START=395 /DNA_END=697 /DNA_ORIENTATION=+